MSDLSLRLVPHVFPPDLKVMAGSGSAWFVVAAVSDPRLSILSNPAARDRRYGKLTEFSFELLFARGEDSSYYDGFGKITEGVVRASQHGSCRRMVFIAYM